MEHDHEHQLSPYLNCNGAGFMSYFDRNAIMPENWSQCNIEDFQDWWKNNGRHCTSLLPQYPGALHVNY